MLGPQIYWEEPLFRFPEIIDSLYPIGFDWGRSVFINQLWEQDDRSWNWLQTRLPALSFRGLRLREKQLEEKNFPFLKNFYYWHNGFFSTLNIWSPHIRAIQELIPTDFPGDPVVKNLPSSVGDVGSVPGWGTKIPHAAGHHAITKNPSTAIKTQCSQNKQTKGFIPQKEGKPELWGLQILCKFLLNWRYVLGPSGWWQGDGVGKIRWWCVSLFFLSTPSFH